MSVAAKQSTDSAPVGRLTSAYDANYESKLAQAGVFLEPQLDSHHDLSVMPANCDQITAALRRRRPSLSRSRFTEQDFQRFKQEVQRAKSESATMQRVIPIIQGQRGRFDFLSDVPFNYIKPFDRELAITKPDQYDGASPRTIDHRVLKSLDKLIIPSRNFSRPAAPNFFLEAKSKSGSLDVAERQAAHNGAIGARAMMSLQSYPSQTLQYDNKAYSFTNTYHDGILRMYLTHATAPESEDDNDQPHYYMTLLRSFSLNDTRKAFREGASYYRNARELAMEQRDSFIHQANQAARQSPPAKRSNPATAVTTATTSIKSTSRDSTDDAEHESSPETDSSIDSSTDGSTDELPLDKTPG